MRFTAIPASVSSVATLSATDLALPVCDPESTVIEKGSAESAVKFAAKCCPATCCSTPEACDHA